MKILVLWQILLKEFNDTKGYAVGFEGLMGFLEALLPSEEVITESVRKTVTKYPMIALREIIANALIHQDFTVSGSSPHWLKFFSPE